MTTTNRTRTAILISGKGSNMEALIDAAAKEHYPAEISLVISNRPKAGGLEIAAAQGIKTAVIDHKQFESRAEFDKALSTCLETNNIELICNAGFMRLLTREFVEQWHNRQLNIHPSLLPSFKGLHTHERALAADAKITGCTVHFVRYDMDTGPIIAQAAVPILPGDTIGTVKARVQKAEHQLYPAALRLAASGRLRIVNERALIDAAPSEAPPLFSLPPED